MSWAESKKPFEKGWPFVKSSLRVEAVWTVQEHADQLCRAAEAGDEAMKAEDRPFLVLLEKLKALTFVFSTKKGIQNRKKQQI